MNLEELRVIRLSSNVAILLIVFCSILFFFSLNRPNCFQIVVQHFSEEHYIFYFAGETPEQAQVSNFSLS